MYDIKESQHLNINLPHHHPHLKYSITNERKILKAVFINYLHQLFSELFDKKICIDQHYCLLECYEMDRRIIKLFIEGIIETGEYTLEGIAYYTRIPLDVIQDAASCINNNHFSVTPWARVASLYLQVNPEIAKMLIDKLLEMKNKNELAFFSLLTEE